MCIDLTDVRSVAQYLLRAGENATTRLAAKQAAENNIRVVTRGADKSLARPGRKQATATKFFANH